MYHKYKLKNIMSNKMKKKINLDEIVEGGEETFYSSIIVLISCLFGIVLLMLILSGIIS